MAINFDQFKLDLYKSKPADSVPRTYVNEHQVTDAEKDKMALPKEAELLIEIMKKHLVQRPNQPEAIYFTGTQAFLCRRIKSLCEGNFIPHLNRWRLINIQIRLLALEKGRVNEAAKKIQSLLVEGNLLIEDHLTGLERNNSKYADGRDLYKEALSLVSKNSSFSNLKERLEILVECLSNQKELFPLLLMPVKSFQSTLLDPGKEYLELLQKMSLLYPKESEGTIETLHQDLTRFKRELESSSIEFPFKKLLSSKIDVILSIQAELNEFWRTVRMENPSSEYNALKKFFALAEKRTPFTPQMFKDWMEAGKLCQNGPKIDIIKANAALQKMLDLRSDLSNLIKASQNTLIKQKEVAKILNGFIGIYLSEEKYSLVNCQIREPLRFYSFFAQGYTLAHQRFWENKLSEMNQFLAQLNDLSPTVSAPYYERLLEALYLTTKKIVHTKSDITPYGHLSRFILILRNHEQHTSSLYEREDSIRRIRKYLADYIIAMDLLSVTHSDPNASKIANLLRAFDKLIYHKVGTNDSFLLLFKERPNLLSKEGLKAVFDICLMIPNVYLSSTEDLDSTILDPLKMESVENLGFEKLKAMHAGRIMREKKLISLMGVKERNYLKIAESLNEFQSWLNNEVKAFFTFYDGIEDEMESLDLNSLKTAFELEVNITHQNLFSPTLPLRQWGFQETYDSEEKTPIKKKSAPSLQAASSSSKTIEAKTVETTEKRLSSIELIDRVSLAVEGIRKQAPPLSLKYLDNLRDDLIPSIRELIDGSKFHKRLKEKTTLLLEQSLKYSHNGAYPNLSEHSLVKLFEPLENNFPEAKLTVNYFMSSKPEGDLREHVSQALALSEALITGNGLKKYNLDEPISSEGSSAGILEGVEIEGALFNFEKSFGEKRAAFSKWEGLYGNYVVPISAQESLWSQRFRQHNISSYIEEIELTTERLKQALLQVDDKTPLAYSGELMHCSALLLEKVLHLLISYYPIQNETEDKHIHFEIIGTQANRRPFRYVHDLELLREKLELHLINCFNEAEVKLIASIRNYNSETHRYLAQDSSSVGLSLKALHKEVCFNSDTSREAFTKFRNTTAHPTAINALNLAKDLLDRIDLD